MTSLGDSIHLDLLHSGYLGYISAQAKPCLIGPCSVSGSAIILLSDAKINMGVDSFDPKDSSQRSQDPSHDVEIAEEALLTRR